MNDKYFRDKIEEIQRAMSINNFTDVEFRAMLYLKLKEVARDQHYATIEEIRKKELTNCDPILVNIIQNS